MTQSMRDIIWTINPANDNFKKLLQKLKSYASGITKPVNTLFTLTVSENVPEEKLSMQQRKNIYLICKEAIANSVKYSQSKNLQMDVIQMDHSVRIKIKDDGIGFDSTESKEGNGLMNMKTRADEIGANLDIHSQIGKGTVVMIEIKL
jgi:signal transduction histidine kinase